MGEPSFIFTTDREFIPASIQFGSVLHFILKAIWEADLFQGPVRFSKLDVTDAYHWGALRQYQMGAFYYIILLMS